MLPDDIFLFFLFINISTITSGRMKKKTGKKNCFQPCRFRGNFTRDSRGCSKESDSENVQYPKVHYKQFWLSSKFSKFSIGPLPVLSEDEEQVLVKWLTNCTQTGFAQRKLCVQLSVKEFLTVNQRKTPFKDNMHGNEWFQAFLYPYPMLCTCSNESITSSSEWGRHQKVVNKLCITVDFFR